MKPRLEEVWRIRRKKIAILSMQRIVNFGSVLQAWSLRQLIHDAVGADADFLDIEDNPTLPSLKSVNEQVDYESKADYPKGVVQRGKRWIITRLSYLNKRNIRAFMSKTLGLKEVEKQAGYDCVVVGSDEVFNHSRGVRLQLHGEIKNADKLISYAASCGTALAEDVRAEDGALVRNAMNNFSAMSVRDSATEYYVSAFYNGQIFRHLDPVLVGSLRNRQHKAVPLKKYLLVYAYGQRIRTAEEINAIKDFAGNRGLKIIAVGGSQFWCDLYIPCKPFRLMDWFFNADYVVTDTFHGVIFSVINHRNFAVIVRQTNERKIRGLLEDLGLECKELKRMDELEKTLLEPPDYKGIDGILDAERKRTIAYLTENLGEK